MVQTWWRSSAYCLAEDLETKMFNDTGHGIPYITGASCINDGDIFDNKMDRDSNYYFNIR